MLAHAPLIRALTRAAYGPAHGTSTVLYIDQHVRKAMIELGPDEALTHAPDWLQERWQAAAGNAAIGTTGDPKLTSWPTSTVSESVAPA